MRLGILASELGGTPTGVGRLLRGLLTCLPECRPDWRFLLFFQGGPFDDPLWSNSRLEPIFLERGSAHPVLFEQFELARLLPALDAFLAPGYSLPRNLTCPSVVAIHDLSFELLPREFRWKERWRRRFLARRAARRASRVLTISSGVAAQLRDLYGVDEDRVGILPLAVEERFFAAGIEPRATDGMPPYAIFVGSIFERRRLDIVLEALAELTRHRPELRLVIAGNNRLRRPQELASWVGRFGVADRVEIKGYVDDEEMVGLLAGAELSFYVSTYEGYGLPPLESLAAGTAVVTSRGLALEELWPDYPYRCEEITVDEVVRVGGRILEDSGERERTLREGVRRVRTLSWRRSAERLAEEIEKAVDR